MLYALARLLRWAGLALSVAEVVAPGRFTRFTRYRGLLPRSRSAGRWSGTAARVLGGALRSESARRRRAKRLKLAASLAAVVGAAAVNVMRGRPAIGRGARRPAASPR
jgi:hypothetical protein